ncbi:MAG: hypothetical protein ACREM2_00995 [Vulcanimicrobiaceae bacterium]
MTHAQQLARTLNALTREPQFSNSKARAAARQDANVDWPRTKAHNDGFNPEVDGCESFAMRDGSICEWLPARYAYAARASG